MAEFSMNVFGRNPVTLRATSTAGSTSQVTAPRSSRIWRLNGGSLAAGTGAHGKLQNW